VRGPLISNRAVGTDVCTCLRYAVLSSWQAEWDCARGNKLRVVKPSMQEWQSSFRVIRKDEVILTCLRIGHLRMTHAHCCEVSRRPPVRTAVSILLSLVSLRIAHVTMTRALCHFEGVISDVLVDDPCRSAVGLATSV
jgi:hypothetical protein